MMKKIKENVKGWLFSLFVMLLWFLPIFDINNSTNYSGHFGYSHGKVEGDLYIRTSSLYAMNFEGESEPHWYWLRPKNYQYQTLKLEWNNYEDGINNIGKLSFPAKTLKHGNSVKDFTLEYFCQIWLKETPDKLSPEKLKAVTEYYNILIAAGNGTLPIPERFIGSHSIVNLMGNFHHNYEELEIVAYSYLLLITVFILIFCKHLKNSSANDVNYDFLSKELDSLKQAEKIKHE